MAFITSEIETPIRINGRNQMRDMRRNIRPVVCSFAETEIYHNGSGLARSGPALSEVPRDGGTFGVRADVSDDNDIDSLSPCCRLAYRMGRCEAIAELAEKMRQQIKGEK